MSFGFRPANASVPVEYPFVEENGVLAAGPQTILDVPDVSVVNAIQRSWRLVKKQADVMIVMDVSGSMNDGDKLVQAQEAARRFVESMESGNRVGLALFSDELEVRVPLDRLETVESRIVSNIVSLRADGGTEMYMALQEIVDALNDEPDADRVRAVVLLSDGEDTGDSGVTLNDALNAVNASRDALNPVIVVPLAYGGNADIQSLNAIAQASRTRVQSGDPENISSLLELISSFF
jgi:Ca-activated chloride channel family protein